MWCCGLATGARPALGRSRHSSADAIIIIQSLGCLCILCCLALPLAPLLCRRAARLPLRRRH
jgi:hypothetical protein